MDDAGLVPLRRQADLPRREGLVLLEHELRAARTHRRGGRRAPAERAAAQPVPGPARARPHLRTDRRAARGPDRAGLSSHGFVEPAHLLGPVRRQQGHALHLGRDRGSGRRVDGGLIHRRRALGAGPLQRRGPAPGDGRCDGRRRAQDGPLPPEDRLWAGGPGDDARSAVRRSAIRAGSPVSDRSSAICPPTESRSRSSRTRRTRTRRSSQGRSCGSSARASRHRVRPGADPAARTGCERHGRRYDRAHARVRLGSR